MTACAAGDGVALPSDDGLAAGDGVVRPPDDASRGSDPRDKPAGPAAVVDGARRFASPLARRMAREAGVDLRDLAGTGPGGRIRRRDVEGVVSGRVRPGEPAAPRSAPRRDAGPADAPVRDAGAHVDEPVTRFRRAIAARLTESKQTVPHFYLRGSARVDRLLALRQEINDGGTIKVTVNDLVVKAVAAAHVLVPGVNVIWNGDSIRHFAQVDIALAIATDAGLVTPVVRGVDHLSLRELVSATGDLILRARERRLQQSELEGGTITVTNLGMFGTEDFGAIINPPQAAILAVGAARPEPVVADGRVEVATVMRVTLSVDHRPVDGATAASWMKVFTGLLENPAQILI